MMRLSEDGKNGIAGALIFIALFAIFAGTMGLVLIGLQLLERSLGL